MLSESVQRFIDAQVAASETSYEDLRAVFLNGTLKRSPEQSHTDGLISIAAGILRGVGATVDTVRMVDHTILSQPAPPRTIHPGAGGATGHAGETISCAQHGRHPGMHGQHGQGLQRSRYPHCARP